VHVTAYDDRGHGKSSKGATVHAGAVTRKTDADGDADLVVPPGHYTVFATKPGAIRSFGEEVDAS
jgi:alpha-beta hydrolase superfamily lysophospholipase